MLTHNLCQANKQITKANYAKYITTRKYKKKKWKLKKNNGVKEKYFNIIMKDHLRKKKVKSVKE